MHNYDGNFYTYEDLEMLPKPYGDIPILIGGFSKIALKGPVIIMVGFRHA